MRALRKLSRMRGGAYRAARKQVSLQRKRLISRNRKHAEDDLRQKIDVREYEQNMPEQFRELYDEFKKSAEGQKALARYKKFWGIMPTNIRVIEMPGPKSQKKFLVGMGRAGKGGKIQLKNGGTTSAKGAKWVATDANGKRIFLLSGNDSNAPKAELREIGKVEETHYVPTVAQEKAGTFKKNKYWVHRHDDDNGKFPTVYQDQAGNYVYGPGTYTVTDWIRR
jgi:hypothetical protein